MKLSAYVIIFSRFYAQGKMSFSKSDFKMAADDQMKFFMITVLNILFTTVALALQLHTVLTMQKISRNGGEE